MIRRSSSRIGDPEAESRWPIRQPKLPNLLLRDFDLFEIKLDRGRAAKDRYRYLDAVFLEIQFLDNAVEACKRAIENLDLVANFVIDRDPLFRCVGCFLFGVEDAGRFGIANRLRLGNAQKAGNFR